MKPGYYWIVTDWSSTLRIARFDGARWWGEVGHVLGEVEAVSDRLEPPVRFEVETVPG